RGGVTQQFASQFRVAVGGVAARIQLFLTEIAGAATNRERHDNAVALLKFRDGRADFFDDAHRLMTENIPLLHRRIEAVEQMEVRPANRRRGNPDNRIAGVFDFRFGDVVAANIADTVPYERFHGEGSLWRHRREDTAVEL